MPGNSFTYLAKFNCNGEYQWHKQFGNDNGGGSPVSLSVSDSIIGFGVSYSSTPTNHYLLDSDTTLFESPSGTNNLLVLYSNSGTLLWHWGTGLNYLRGSFPNFFGFSYWNQGGYTYAEENEVWYGFSKTNDSGRLLDIPITDTATYLTKIKANGTLDTVYMIYPKSIDLLNSIHFISPNELLIYFRTGLPFYAAGDTFTSGGGNFIAKIDTLGNFYWANNTSNGIHVEVTQKKDIFVFGGGIINYNVFGLPRMETGSFLAKIDKSTGDAIWLSESKRTGVSIAATAFHEKANGKLILGGDLVGSAVFGPDTIQSYSNTDMWIEELDLAGNHISIETIVGRPSASVERMHSISTDPADNVYFGGYFEGRLEYLSDTVFKRGGVSDGFFAKLGTPGCFVCPTTVAQFSSLDSFLKVNFDASQSLEADSFYWDFDDGTTDTGISPIHTFSMDGSYNVCLIAESDCDSDTLCQMITVADSMVGIDDLNSLEVSVYPNPSRDGVFRVRTEAGLDGEIVVLDLLGKLVLTQSISQDGRTILEMPTITGTYFMELNTSTRSKAEMIQIR
jgi:PKD repeat protein